MCSGGTDADYVQLFRAWHSQSVLHSARDEERVQGTYKTVHHDRVVITSNGAVDCLAFQIDDVAIVT